MGDTKRMKHKRILEAIKHFGIKYQKKLKIGLVLIAAVFLTSTIVMLTKSDPEITRTSLETTAETEVEPAVTLVPSPLDGSMVDQITAAQPITAVVIENSPEARPQSSLNQAGVVFEAIAEGGITRFVALYQQNRPEIIGPIRSLRPYFIDWALMYDAPIAHVGGSAEALDQARALGIKDLDEFALANTFYRATDRFAPHNVYTSFERLDATNQNLGFTDNDFTQLPRKEDSPVAIPDAAAITLNISSFLYRVDYNYDITTNSYLRTLAGNPHIDRESQAQLNPKVVIVANIANRVVDFGRQAYDMVGSGTVQIFQDGTVIDGTWSRASQSSQFSFTDVNGDPIELNRGQTWITALDIDQSAVHQP